MVSVKKTVSTALTKTKKPQENPAAFFGGKLSPILHIENQYIRSPVQLLYTGQH